MSRFLISAAHKSSGKTTIAVGLCAALTAQGLVVQPFKKGPDYIDPMWLSQASGRDCFNLDPFLMTPESIAECFMRYAAQADIGIVEGNKGLYDGLALDGSNCNAALAHLLDLPVVLVLDARGMTRGIAPLILGYQAFDTRIRIAGVILNQLGGARHESKLRSVIEHYTDVPVLGAIGHDPRLALVERHLGLMPNHELMDAAQQVHTIGELIAAQVDLPRVLALAASAPPLPPTPPAIVPVAAPVPLRVPPPARVRIGLARDKAFGFYYPDDLLALEAAGAELVPFDTLRDAALPAVDGLFIGGGFPEVFMPELSANTALRTDIRAAIEAGLPVYAECGGLMYLARRLRWQDRVYDMVGALPADVLMHERPVGRGYVKLQATADAPWLPRASAAAPALRGHEFHYSSLENVAPDIRFAYRVLRGHGVDGQHDGIVYRNVLASYAHLRSGAGSDWASQFVAFVRAHRMAAQSLAKIGAHPRSENMFTLTSAAARQILQAANSSGAQEMALRIAARVEQDGSLQYGMGFDDPREEDMKLELDGVAVVIADASQELLAHTVLDYVEMEPGEFNFIFIDASQSGCDTQQAAGGACSSAGCGGCASAGRTQ